MTGTWNKNDVKPARLFPTSGEDASCRHFFTYGKGDPRWMVKVFLLEDDPFVILDMEGDRIVGTDFYEAMVELIVYDATDRDDPRFRFFAVWSGGVYANLYPVIIQADDLVAGVSDQWAKVGGAVDVLNLSNDRDVNDSSPYTLDDFKRTVLSYAQSLVDEPESVEHNLTAYGFEVR